MSTTFSDTSDIALIEGIPVTGFPNPVSLFERLLAEIQKPKQSIIYALNVNAANIAYSDPNWREILCQGDLIYCDGAGIVWASKLLNQPITGRLTAADWMLDLLAYFAEQNIRVYFLAGEPGIPEKAMSLFDEKVPEHTVMGAHHGYIHQDSALEDLVISEINRFQPDVLIVGFGMPLQEEWIHQNRHRLNTRMIWATGATLDYLTEKVSRCPNWLGNLGFEWLYRFCLEPIRLFNRYVIGNPWFMSRILLSIAKEQAKLTMTRRLSNPRFNPSEVL